ncbi:hypothetical protein STRATTON_75 [Erwinia phage vB_EamM_Stratton]|uniref:Uncharacterized protein n=1 Tax=Erwinia phage vB_EamM_Stratton TaxID=1883378 RepID=A0A1B2IGV2_9CAUD|nr:hypothetical protein STRATTON_75 [Erwinia phage vB_EamM_Stratton]
MNPNNSYPVKRITLTEEGAATARTLTSCPMKLTDALIGQDGIFLIFGERDRVFHRVDQPEEFLQLAATLGDQEQTSDVAINVTPSDLFIVRDKHSACGLRAVRWKREWLARA